MVKNRGRHSGKWIDQQLHFVGFLFSNELTVRNLSTTDVVFGSRSSGKGKPKVPAAFARNSSPTDPEWRACWFETLKFSYWTFSVFLYLKLVWKYSMLFEEYGHFLSISWKRKKLKTIVSPTPMNNRSRTVSTAFFVRSNRGFIQRPADCLCASLI